MRGDEMFKAIRGGLKSIREIYRPWYSRGATTN